MKINQSNHMNWKTAVILILALTFVMLFKVVITLPFEFPDEQAHIITTEFLSNEGRMPGPKDRDMTPEMKKTQDILGTFRDPYGNNKVTYHPEYRLEYTDTYVGLYEEDIKKLNVEENRSTYIWQEAAHYPVLYYAYESIWQKIANNYDIISRLFIMRIANIPLYLATMYYVYKLGTLVFDRKIESYTLGIMVALHPMYSFMSAGVNPDNLHHLFSTIIVYLGALMLKKGITTKVIISSILLVTLDIATKPQGFILIGILILALVWRLIIDKKWKVLIYIGLMSIILSTFILSPLNPYRYWMFTENSKNVNFIEFIKFSVNKLISQNIVWYWGVFKWLGVVLQSMYWQIANRVILLSGIGLFAYIYRSISRKKIPLSATLVTYLFVTNVIYIGAIYWFDWQFVKNMGYSLGIQARYFFPMISSQMALLIIGVTSLIDRDWYRQLTSRLLGIFIIWMQIGGIWRLITSYYDVTSLQLFITQASQYKPAFAKGEWWYLWIGLYVISLLYLAYLVLKPPIVSTKEKT